MQPSQRIAAVVILLVGWTAPAAADDRQVYQVLDISVINHGDLRADDELTTGLRLALGRSFAQATHLGPAVELGLFANPIERHPVADDFQLGLMLDLLHTFDLGGLQPFLLGGVGIVREHDAAGASTLVPAVEAGAGLMLGRQIRLGVTVQDVLNDELTTTQDSFLDYRLSLGARFGAAGGPAPAPQPADADGDGVADAVDRCPRQPAATADGCPAAPVLPAARERDTDGDGIPDGKDECPGTLAGLKVDASGCVAAASAQRIVLKGVNFLPGSADLTPEARAVLDEAAAALAGQAALKVEVGGHTDSRGDEKLNQALSQRRAEAVRDYLAGKGIAAARLSARGYGETQPIADNATRTGRQENRRVELKILN